MKLRSVFLRKRNAFIVLTSILLLGTYAVHQVAANSGGVLGYSKIGCGLPSQDGCHGTQSSNTAISISTDSSQILPGKTYVFRLSVTNPTEKGAGCNISVDNGAKLGVNGYNSGLWIPYGSGELTHNGPRTFTGDSAVWLFQYTAPTKVGTAHIFIACNAVDLNGTNDNGDHWNVKVDTLKIGAAGVTPTENSSATLEIFPNPSSSGRYILTTQGVSGVGDVTVSNASGTMVSRSQITLGTNEPLDLSALANGTYFVSVRTKDGGQWVKRVVVAK